MSGGNTSVCRMDCNIQYDASVHWKRCEGIHYVICKKWHILYSAYFDSDYGNYVGYYTSYKYIDVDHAKLQVIKDDRVIKESEAKLDKNKIDFEQQKTNK